MLEIIKNQQDCKQISIKEATPFGKWHCFDIPFVIACGGNDFAERIKTILTPYANDIKCSIGIGVDSGMEEQP